MQILASCIVALECAQANAAKVFIGAGTTMSKLFVALMLHWETDFLHHLHRTENRFGSCFSSNQIATPDIHPFRDPAVSMGMLLF